MTALVVSGLAFGYDDGAVLRDVDLRVDDGITAVLGPSGCGKTTLLRLVAGFLRPRAGTVTLGGDRVADGADPRAWVSPKDRSVGYLPQEGALFPHLDVASNVLFGLPRPVRRGADGAARAAELLDLVGLPPSMARRQPHELSGGQQQRVALARALAPAPSLVLLDEPFSSLDAGLREDTGIAVSHALRASGAAALLVTHDRGEALSLADQVAVMDEGRFLQVASPVEVYRRPSSVPVASFVGDAVLLPATRTGPGTATCVLGTADVDGCGDGPLLLAIPQEQVRVAAPHPGATGAEGVVTDVLFLGRDLVVRVEVLDEDGPVRVTARVSAPGTPVAVGARVLLSISGTVRAFPAGDGA